VLVLPKAIIFVPALTTEDINYLGSKQVGCALDLGCEDGRLISQLATIISSTKDHLVHPNVFTFMMSTASTEFASLSHAFRVSKCAMFASVARQQGLEVISYKAVLKRGDVLDHAGRRHERGSVGAA
jgi:hypothetical protein